MPQLELRDSLCGDLLRLALSCGNGRLKYQGMLAIGVRASLLLDLVMVGAIERDRGGALSINASPTGCRAADEVIEFAVRRPNSTIDHMVRRGRPYLALVVREMVTTGVWRERRRTAGIATSRFEDAEAEQYARERRRIANIMDDRARPRSEREALLAALADAMALSGPRNDPATPDVPLRYVATTKWLAPDIIELIDNIRFTRAVPAHGTGGDGASA